MGSYEFSVVLVFTLCIILCIYLFYYVVKHFVAYACERCYINKDYLQFTNCIKKKNLFTDILIREDDCKSSSSTSSP